MSEARIIDGKAFAAELRGRIGGAVSRLKNEHGLTPGLAVVLVGENPASQVYVRNKNRQTAETGMNSFHHALPAETSQDELLELVARLNADPTVHGILVQLPLPDQIDAPAVLDAIDPDKDVDGFHVVNAGRLMTGTGKPLVPCTPLGCMMLLREYAGDLTGKRAVIVGRSNIVGAPTSSASPWPIFCWASTARSPSPTRGPATCRRNAVRPTFWWPRSAGPKWSAAIGSSRARRFSTSASIGSKRPRARAGWSATSPSTRRGRWPARSRRCPAASGP
jgi:methylenetetrahydrofolate dehydrogenase (NADP+)/methenyltetrahydrofolate cyclohydrolase